MVNKATMATVLATLAALAGSVAAGSPDPAVDLGAWYCAGPFKDTAFGLHLRSFGVVFPPEKQALAAGGKQVDLSRTWQVTKYPGMTDRLRRWVRRADWADGYRNLLPVGPAPMKNETCYLYRTITARRATSVDMRVYAEDNVRAWINGELLGEAHTTNPNGASRFAAALLSKLHLKAGENRLLVKITSMHGVHGFAFAIDGLTPSNSFLPGDRIHSVPRIGPGTAPLASAGGGIVDYAAAMARLGGHRFDVEPIPMYSPARLKIDEALTRLAPQTAAGRAWLDRNAALKARAGKALAAARGKSVSPDSAAARAVIDVADGIEKMWTDEFRRLGPIAFIRCPPFAVNAIAPYIAAGANPASICVLDPNSPGEPRVIFHEPETRIFDMNVSYDGRTILFSARRPGIEGGWHIYEIGADGRGLRQITAGNCSDISPLLLPGGEVMFVSTRRGNAVVCQKRPSGVLYVADRDGSNVRRVSGNTLSDHTPQMMNDGRVLFTRWDYGMDKNVFCRQTLWTMYPDGTQFRLFYGNTIENPNGFWQARAIPGRPEVVCVLGPHHQFHAGMIGLVWDGLGIEAPRGEGMRWITRELPTIGDMTLPWGYQDPFPVHEHMFLVSYGGDGQKRNRLYLLDDRGNRRCIYEDQKLGCWSPLLLRPKRKPPVVVGSGRSPEFAYRPVVEANRTPGNESATLVLQDVYEGIGKHVKRGEVKALQIAEQVPKIGDPVGDQIWGYSPTVGRGTMYVRRLIGTVPVEADGSAHFKVPAGRDISFNALDAEGRVIRHMGSTMHLAAGEVQGCVGCHEPRDTVPPIRSAVPLAIRRAASIPTSPKWAEGGIIDFVKVVQPVLDKHCVKCHRGPTPPKGVDLSGDKTHIHSQAYDQLLDRGLVHYVPVAGTGHAEGTARARGAMVSRIRRFIEADHSGKPLPLSDRERIYAWIDMNVPYYGTYEFTNTTVLGGRERWYVTDRKQWFRKDFLPVFNRRCLSCHERYVTPQTYNYNPRGGKIAVSSKLWNDTALSSFQLGHGRISMIGQVGPPHRFNLTHPDWSQMLTAPLAKSAGGLGKCLTKAGAPVFKDKADSDYILIRQAIRKGAEQLKADPRVDMREAEAPGASAGRDRVGQAAPRP